MFAADSPAYHDHVVLIEFHPGGVRPLGRGRTPPRGSLTRLPSGLHGEERIISHKGYSGRQLGASAERYGA